MTHRTEHQARETVEPPKGFSGGASKRHTTAISTPHEKARSLTLVSLINNWAVVDLGLEYDTAVYRIEPLDLSTSLASTRHR